jgi:hypothetical protein
MMKIDNNTENGIFQTAVVIKDGAPLGLVQELETDTKQYKKLVWPAEDPDNPEVETGTYDRFVICVDELPDHKTMPNQVEMIAKMIGLELLTHEEMTALRKEMGVVVK